MIADTLIFVSVVFTFFQYQALTLDNESEEDIDNSDRMLVLWCACGIFFNPLMGILGHVFSSYGIYILLTALFYDFVIPIFGLIYFFVAGWKNGDDNNQ